MLKKNCKNCQQALVLKEASFKNNRWRCGKCQTDHPLIETLLTPSDLAYKDKIKNVKGVQVVTSPSFKMTVSAGLKGNGWVFLFIGVLLLWFMQLSIKPIINGQTELPGTGWIIFDVCLLALGLLFTWIAVNRLFVSSIIRISNEMIFAQNLLFGQFSIWQKEVPTQSIKQVFVGGEQDFEEGSDFVQNQVSFTVMLLLKDGSQALVISGLRNYKHAFFIERQLKKALGIEDEIMAGEFIPFWDLVAFKIPNMVKKGFHLFRVLRWFGD